MRRERLMWRVVATSIVGLLAVPVVALAAEEQAGAREQRKQRRAKFVAKMKAHRGKMLREHVGLSDAKATKVERLMNNFHEKRRAVRASMRPHHRQLRRLLKQDSNDQGSYKRALDAVIAGRAKIARLKDEQVRRLRTLLSPKQQAKVLMAMLKMKRRMHRRMMKARSSRSFEGRAGRGRMGRRGRLGPGAAGDQGEAPWEDDIDE